MPSGTRSAKIVGAGSGRKTAINGSSQKETTFDGVISKEDFLASRIVFLRSRNAQSLPSYRLWTESCAVASPLCRPTRPPPGLAPPPGLELPDEALSPGPENQEEPLPEKPEEPEVEQQEPEPQQYKVLLQNLPETMLKECMLQVMLEQAKLNDATDFSFRANGKALITFSTYASVGKCIGHFDGRKWGSSSMPVSATYVRTVKSGQNQSENDAPPQETKVRSMSADAPAFVPACMQFAPLSRNVPIFESLADKACARDRFHSDASTEAGLASSDGASDGCPSEEDIQVVCTY